MSRSLNKVMLIGNLTRDPEVRYTEAGTAVASFSIATNRTWKDANQVKQEDVAYHRIVAWSKLAEICGQLLTKGKKVYIEGRIQYRKFTDKTGAERDSTEIVAENMMILDAKGNGQPEPGDDQEPQ
jgi:single-strand DNA-binding protein